jgi:2-polyprenyl-3-methyl-5-hydroxy-6-metoxy-1,4-benzoquinol methylase
MSVRIPVDILNKYTNPAQERNIYVHPNPLARDIFWSRLERVFKYLQKYTKPTDKFLDFGGGSGVFNLACSKYYNQVDVIDLDNSDAQKLKDFYKLDNVNLITQDISKWKPETPYDVVIATDVLEHFADLTLPLDFMKANIRRAGLLVVSLPTENWIYELGRKLVNKTKPVDHYHTSAHVIATIKKNGFREVKRSFVPQYVVPVPLFEIAVFERP